MPDTSDSEAFESADEDFVDSKPRKPEVSVVKPIEDVVKQQKQVDTTCSPNVTTSEVIPTITKDIGNESIPENVPTKREEEHQVDIGSYTESTYSLKQSPEDVHISSVKPKENQSFSTPGGQAAVLKNTSNEGSNTKNDILDERKPSVVSTKNDEDEGWEFDDWGDETPAPVVKQSATVAKTSDDDDDVGWEVDDWGDDLNPNESKATNAKTDKTPTNSLGNFSKMQISNSIEPQKSSPDKTPNPLDRLSDSGDSSLNWGWKPWGGVVNLLSTATDGVASITSHVSSVIESGIGVPDPSEMARIQQQEHKKRQQEKTSDDAHLIDAPEEVANRPKRGDDASLLLGQFVSGMTHIGNRVISGGLDTLEGIGKKTMTILKENDKGLLDKQRQMLMEGQGPALSQVFQ